MNVPSSTSSPVVPISSILHQRGAYFMRQLMGWHSCDGWLRWRHRARHCIVSLIRLPRLPSFDKRYTDLVQSSREIYKYYEGDATWQEQPKLLPNSFEAIMINGRPELRFYFLRQPVPFKANGRLVYQETIPVSVGGLLYPHITTRNLPSHASKESLLADIAFKNRRTLSPEKGTREFFHC